jgi:uncharacterized membrane-anchored protein
MFSSRGATDESRRHARAASAAGMHEGQPLSQDALPDPVPTRPGVRASWAARHRRPLSKVPEIIVLFWVTKILTTGMGEAASDYLVSNLARVVAVMIGFLALLIALAWQFWVHRYVVWVYWLAVSMVAVFGTMAADVLHKGLGIPYVVSTLFFAVVLALVFATWYRTERTLSIHSIHTPRRELFYWVTVLTTFALGTAAGDMTASTLHLGYLDSGFLFTALFLVPAVAYWQFGMNAIFAFWFAYVLTRPLGASFADWLDKPTSLGGLGLGTGTVAAISAAVIVGLVAYLALTHSPIEEDDALRLQ